jgi:glycosyltransferase involved in cell wall biosynthesis
MKPHVVHVTSVHPRYDTRIFLKECCSLAKQGYQVTLVVADGLGSEQRHGVAIYDTGKMPWGRVGRILLTPWRVMFAALRCSPRVVHFHDPELMFPAYLLSMLGYPVVFDMHENVPKQILNKGWLPKRIRKLLSKIYLIVERFALNRFEVVFAENSYSADYVWVRRCTTVLNLPDVRLLPVQSGVSKFPNYTIGYIGGGTRARGVVVVAQAVGMLRAKGIEIDFLCIGPMSDEVCSSEVFRSAVDAGWIHSPGRISGPDGWEIIARCHLGIAVLQPIPNYIDSWPTKMFEYMAMGLPVIVSNFQLYRDVVERHECGICVDPMDVVAVAQAIEYLVAYPNEAKRMGDNGKAAVHQSFEWKNEELKLLALYRSLIRGGTISGTPYA